MSKYKLLAAASLALVLLASCGTTSDILGGGSSRPSNYEIRGTVDSVDLNSRSIYLTNVSGYNTNLMNGGGNGSSVRVYYDDRTSVQYQGRSHRPEDLERGDQVAVNVDDSGSRLMASTVTVTYDVASGGSYPSSGSTYPSGTYGSTLRGTVRNVDTSRRTLELDRGYGSATVIDFATNTPVYYNNQTYRPADLERGDEIDVRVSDLGGGRYTAQDITVVRNVSMSSGSTGSTSYSTIRGTVRYVDTSRHTIELESTSWRSGFNSSTGSGSTVIVQYDTNASVEVAGRLNPVSGLERGDIIDVDVRNLGNSNFLAQRIVLVRDVNQR